MRPALPWARTLAVVLFLFALACVGRTVLSRLFFFGAPIALAMLAVACAAALVATLAATRHHPSTRELS